MNRILRNTDIKAALRNRQKGFILNSYRYANAGPSNEVLRLEFEGSDGSTVITDSSSSPKTCTAFGNAQIDTEFAAVGSSSLLITSATATVNNRVIITHNPALRILNNPFSITARVRWKVAPAASNYSPVFLAKRGVSNNFEFTFSYISGGLQLWLSDTGTTIPVIVSRTWAPSINTWYKVKAERAAGVMGLYVDDVLLGSTVADTTSVFSGSGDAAVGNDNANGIIFQGNIDQVIFTIG